MDSGPRRSRKDESHRAPGKRQFAFFLEDTHGPVIKRHLALLVSSLVKGPRRARVNWVLSRVPLDTPDIVATDRFAAAKVDFGALYVTRTTRGRSGRAITLLAGDPHL